MGKQNRCFKTFTISTLRNLWCIDSDNRSLEFILSVENETDINANDLREELRDVSRMLQYSTKPFDVLNYLCQNRLISLYPNTVVALRILLTLPVSVASGKRSFSKLKLIKNYLRSSIG